MFLPIAERPYLARENYVHNFNAPTSQTAKNFEDQSPARKSLSFRTVIISDTHLGRLAANAEFLLEFLTYTDCERLIIAGDGIDGWDLESSTHRPFPEIHARCLDALNSKASTGTDVIDLRGNHDERKAISRYRLMSRTITFKNRSGSLSAPIKFAKSFVHTDAKNRRLLILHGDVFDNWQKKSWMKKIATATDFLYEPIVRCSNAFRKAVINLTGIDISIVAPLKVGTKWLVGAVKSFNDAVAKDSIRQKFDGVVCGHIHHAQIHESTDFLYMNSGDWVEGCRCLVETNEGEWRVLVWAHERRKLGLKRLPKPSDKNPHQAYRCITERQIGLIHRVWPSLNMKETRQPQPSQALPRSKPQQRMSVAHGDFTPQPLPTGA